MGELRPFDICGIESLGSPLQGEERLGFDYRGRGPRLLWIQPFRLVSGGVAPYLAKTDTKAGAFTYGRVGT